MNKEAIEKFRNVIEDFLEFPDLGVWTRGCEESADSWVLTDNPLFDLSSIYVYNDNHAELRKYQEDGLVIQCCATKENFMTCLGTEWYDLEFCDFKLTPEYYRLKP